MANLYVSNPHNRRKKAKKTGSRRAAPRKAARKPSSRRRPNPPARRIYVAKRRATSAPRAARRRYGARRRVYRRPATSRAVAARRPNGASARPRGRGRQQVRHVIVMRRNNPLSLSNPAHAMSSIPIFGTAIGLIGPAIFGVISIETIGQTVKFVSNLEMLQEYTPQVVKDWAPKFAYTLGGLLLAGLLQLMTFIPASYRQSLGLAMASAGGGVDWYRHRSEAGAYGDLSLGDGGNWSVEELGADDDDDDDDLSGLDDDLGALELGARELGDYAGEEDYCGDDFSPEEGQAFANARMFKRYPHARGQKTRAVEGHRWRWLAQHVHPSRMKELARMKPAERQAAIAQFRAEFKAKRRAAGGAGLRLVDKGGIAQNASAMPSAPYVETTGAGASF